MPLETYSQLGEKCAVKLRILYIEGMEKKKLILQMLNEPGANAYLTVMTPNAQSPQSIHISVDEALKLLSPKKREIKKG